MISKEILKEEAGKLLAPGYSPLESGYYQMPNGDWQVRVLIRMPYCKGKMVDWWFGYIKDTATYKLWHQDHQLFEWDDKWKPGHYIGATHRSREALGPEIADIKIKFYDPSEIFDTSKFTAAHISAAVCASVVDDEGQPHGEMIHCVRDTDFGCEMRNRFFLIGAPEPVAAGVLKHSLEEMGNLAQFLPYLYSRETANR